MLEGHELLPWQISHKYSENQYQSTTPCAPRCPSDRSLLRQRRTHLLHSTLLSPHPPGAHLREGRKVTSTGLRAEQYWSLLEPYIASLPHTKYALIYIYSGIASPLHRYDERSDIWGGKCPAPAKQPQKEGGFRGEARRKTWLYQK